MQMKVSLWYVLREFRTRPKRFLSLVAVSAAILSVMILVVLWEEAAWRADVMPAREENYHFSFYNLTDADKEYIKKQPWTKETYDLYRSAQDPAYANTFRVRVKEEYWGNAIGCARQILISRNLLNRAPYKKIYSDDYQMQYKKLLERWYGMTVKNGVRIEDAAALNARNFVLLQYIQNTGYTMRTQNGYIMQPGFLSFLFVLALFLGASILILALEMYRSNFKEYGSLRALGLKKEQIFFINLWESLFINVLAIPLAAGATYGAVQLYFALTAKYTAMASDVYFTITNYIPLSVLSLLALYLIVTALGSTVLSCFMYRKKAVMSLLRGEDTFKIPFVAKTSTRFEDAWGIGAYGTLYGVRARATLVRFTLIVAIMLPLPTMYLLQGVGMLTMLDTPSRIVEAIYSAFQIAAVLITTLSVTYSASRMLAQSRAQELAIIRALGGSRKDVRRVTYPVAAAQAGAILLLSLFVNAAISKIFSTGNYIGSTEGAKAISELVSIVIVYAVSTTFFVIPSAFSGLLTFLHGFFRRPIITSIREQE